jgi:hypothetical protein
MAYRITQYTKDQAKKYGLEVKPSQVKGKKIAVFKKGEKVADVGALGYGDYPTFLEQEKQGKHPKGFANMKRKSYKSRHENDRHVRGSRGWYADKLLW